ncbi:MAG: hypothetical protein MI742_08400 [Desulfobacterales bacterium]|nr:hypothetical protein [Desulfobacterales bacterium]
MSYDRGASPNLTDWEPSVHHCPLLLPDLPPLREVATHRAVSSKDGMHLAVPLRDTDNNWKLFTLALPDQTHLCSRSVQAISNITPIKGDEFAWLAMDEEGWRAMKNDEEISPVTEFAWNLTVSPSGRIAFESQSNRAYTPFAGDAFWQKGYESTLGLTQASKANTTAAVVQTTPIAEGDLATFASGCFTLATEKGPWSQLFMGAYTPVLSRDGKILAADVRLSNNRCTIAVNGQCWEESWPEVWAPVIEPTNQKVFAPVKSQGRWWLYANGKKHWETSALQLWELHLSLDGKRMAAVASPSFGAWTLALEDTLWRSRVDGFLARPVFSPCASRLATTGRHKNRAIVLIDDQIIDQNFHQTWQPVFSPHGSHVAFKAQKKGDFFIYLDGAPVGEPYLWLAHPQFSPDGKALLICGLKKNGGSPYYVRTVIATE